MGVHVCGEQLTTAIRKAPAAQPGVFLACTSWLYPTSFDTTNYMYNYPFKLSVRLRDRIHRLFVHIIIICTNSSKQPSGTYYAFQ